MIHLRALVEEPLAPSSSPRMLSAGYISLIRLRINCSHSLSAIVTGEPSALRVSLTPCRKCAMAIEPADLESSMAKNSSLLWFFIPESSACERRKTRLPRRARESLLVSVHQSDLQRSLMHKHNFRTRIRRCRADHGRLRPRYRDHQ